MRSFDTWNRYLDNSGNPLHGCIQFMVQDGNTIAPIFDQDGIPLVNPQITDIYGRTQHQVFIDNDVTAYFYKYIGDGIWTTEEDIDTSDNTKWQLQYTVGSQNTIDLSITSDTNVSVANISSLRSLAVSAVPEINGAKVITLLGYNNIGDKEPINYYWDSDETTLNDDGGSVIQSSTSLEGRWIMVQPTEHCDSRHFGVFPSNSMNMEDQTYQIVKLFEYTESKGIRPFFNGSEDYAWFKYTNLNVTAKAIDCTNYTKFNDNGMSYIYGEWNGNPTFYNTNTSVYAKVVDTKWGASSYPIAKEVTFTQNCPQSNFQDCVFIANTTVSGYNFRNCEIKSDHKLIGDNNTFTKCKLTASMFGDNVHLANKCSDCEFDIDDFVDSLDLYKQIRLTDDDNPNFDYRCIETNINPFTLYLGNKVHSNVLRLYNYNSSSSDPVNIGLIENTTLELFNCTGNFNLSSYGYGSVVLIKNCQDLTISNIGSGVTLIIENSNVGLPTKNIGSLSLKDSNVYNGTITCDSFGCYSSILSTTINCKDCVIKDSQLNAAINQTINGITSTFIDNNIFNAQLSIAGASGTQILSATITNNVGNAANPIVLDRTYLDSVDSHHVYTYNNNNGTFPKRSVKFSESISILNNIQNYTGSEMIWTLAEGTYGVKMPYVAMPVYYYDDGSTYYRHHFKFGTQVSLFRVGTDEVTIRLDWQMNSIDNNSGYIIPTKFNAKLVHTNGESYRIESNWVGEAPGDPINGQLQIIAILNAYNNVTTLGTATMNGTFTFNLD